jgi:ABC-type sugar transport system substrate-binding protein
MGASSGSAVLQTGPASRNSRTLSASCRPVPRADGALPTRASFKETAEQLGLTLKFYDSQNDLAKQVAGFQQFIQDPEVNVIVMSPLETTGWEQVLKDAKAAGKPVILPTAASMALKITM